MEIAGENSTGDLPEGCERVTMHKKDASCERRKKTVPSILIKFVMHNSLPFFHIGSLLLPLFYLNKEKLCRLSVCLSTLGSVYLFVLWEALHFI
jgi:hypothetical protein